MNDCQYCGEDPCECTARLAAKIKMDRDRKVVAKFLEFLRSRNNLRPAKVILALLEEGTLMAIFALAIEFGRVMRDAEREYEEWEAKQPLPQPGSLRYMFSMIGDTRESDFEPTKRFNYLGSDLQIGGDGIFEEAEPEAVAEKATYLEV